LIYKQKQRFLGTNTSKTYKTYKTSSSVQNAQLCFDIKQNIAINKDVCCFTKGISKFDQDGGEGIEKMKKG
jgi:hypothetical protein